jgi:hypothetical protein
MVDTTDIEKKSLEAHVELCAERYRALEFQIATVKADIDEVKELSGKTHSLVHKLTEQRNNQLINWGIGVIGALAATVGWLLTHYVFK